MTDPVQVVHEIYAAMAAKDFAAIFERLDESFVVTQDDRLPWGGRFEGHDGFASFGLTIGGTIDSAVTIDAIFEADGWVVETGRTRGTVKANGAAFDIAEVHRWRIGPDGKALEAHFAIDTPAMLRVLSGGT